MSWRHRVFGGFLAAAALLAALPGVCAPAAVALPADPSADVWLHGQPHAIVARGSITVSDALAGRLNARLAQRETSVTPLSRDNELWMPLLFSNPSSRALQWQLEVSPPALDEVTLFETSRGASIELASGDRVSQSDWPRAGRFARFDIRLGAGETRQVFLRVRNSMPSTVVPRVVSQAMGERLEQRANIGIGIVLGALALLIGACLWQAAVFRDAAYFLYGAYALLLGLAFASLSGIAGQYVWGDWTAWNDSSKAVFPLAAAGCSVLLARELCRLRTRGPRLAMFTRIVGGLILLVGVPLGVLGIEVPMVMASSMSLAAACVLSMALWTWHRGDRMGAWVVAAHAPLIGVTVLVVLRMFGIAPFEFDSSALLSVAIGAILPLMLVAVNQRSREFLAVQSRARELTHIDPLTGLLAPEPFTDRVRAAVQRWLRSRHDAAVIYLRVTNYSRIQETHGSAAAEQAMIRTAIRLQRLMPDADCMGRVSQNTVGLIVETVTDRTILRDRASRIVAHGLMPVPDLKPEINLNFHVAIAVLSDNPPDAQAVQMLLSEAMASVSARTRRPIRFVEPAASQSPPPDTETESDRDALPA